jgi:two-component system, cell cycle response regulator DivK
MYLNLENKRVLIVEDEELNWLLLRELLNDTGAELKWVDNGYEAIDLIKDHQKFDLILMDIKLPFLDGLETTKAIKALEPSIPIIAQTAYALPDEEEECLKAGCDEYISKPINVEEFIYKAQRVLEVYSEKTINPDRHL